MVKNAFSLFNFSWLSCAQSGRVKNANNQILITSNNDPEGILCASGGSSNKKRRLSKGIIKNKPSFSQIRSYSTIIERKSSNYNIDLFYSSDDLFFFFSIFIFITSYITI